VGVDNLVDNCVAVFIDVFTPLSKKRGVLGGRLESYGERVEPPHFFECRALAPTKTSARKFGGKALFNA